MNAASVALAFLEQAREYLRDDYLPKIERCLERLTDEQVWWRAGEHSNSIGNLLLHLEGNVRQWIVSGVGGVTTDERDRQSEFDERRQHARSLLLERLRRTLSDTDAVLAQLDPSALDRRLKIQGQDVSVLAAIFHVVEHFSMHTGQIILLTKMHTDGDLRFYDFSDGTSRHNWHKGSDR
ncbi:MAG TPA: DinB family protein [Pyrinomonadaceae bacterium]|nr:DinB family protein [Pyrinomonadaceae bacterium]